MPTPQKKLGQRGEQLAKEYLERKGLVFVEQNFHAQGGEIDLIFTHPKDKNFIFVEVKTRKNKAFGDIHYSVTRSKIKKMLSAIRAYFFKKLNCDETPDFQIDVVFVQQEKAGEFSIDHLENIGLEDF